MKKKPPKLTTGQHGKNKSFEFLSFIKTEKNMCQVKWPAIGLTLSVWFINIVHLFEQLTININIKKKAECKCNNLQL